MHLLRRSNALSSTKHEIADSEMDYTPKMHLINQLPIELSCMQYYIFSYEMDALSLGLIFNETRILSIELQRCNTKMQLITRAC